jgi:hypothetical protein
MPLAGAVGLHVAKTPSSRPEIPAGPDAFSDREEQVDEVEFDEDLPIDAASRPIGDLAGAGTAVPLTSKPLPDSGVETLELDNVDPTPAIAAAASKPKSKKDKKLSVPDFNRFRVLLIAGGVLLILLIVGGYFAFSVLPKATISIKTNASNVNTNVDFALSTSATSFDASSEIVPAKQVQVQKTLTGNAPATGQKNNGEKASGSVTMSAGACSANIPNSVPSGTGISSGGKTYITQESTSFVPTSQGNRCVYRASNVTTIKAQTGGANFNTSANATFNVSGRADVSATGSADGGTDDIQTVISQADIDTAKGKIAGGENTAQEELETQLDDLGLYAINATYSAGEPKTSNSANVGDASSSVTVTQVITYTMLGANEDHIKTLVDNDIKDQIDTSKQGILSQGVTQAAFKLKNVTASGASMNLQTTAEVGPSIDTDQIAKDAAGKKANEIETSIKNNPDITEVEVKTSPFWVSKAPKASKITVIVAKPTQTANAE